MFPVVFHLIIALLDYTLDKVEENNKEDNLEVYRSIIKKQEEIKKQVNDYKRTNINDKGGFKEIQANLLEMFRKEGNEFIPKFQKEVEEDGKFSVQKFFQLVFSVLLVIGLVQFVFFGSPEQPPNPTDAPFATKGPKVKRSKGTKY